MHFRMLSLFLATFMLVSSCFAQLGRKAIAGAAFVPPKRWAIVIGAQEYENYGRLKYASRDAKSFADLLINELKFRSDAIDLIIDGPDSNSIPNAETIRRKLSSTLVDKRLDKGDLFIFYFAGHGVGTPNGDYLLPIDATKESAEKVGIQAKEIVAAFVKAGLKNVLIIADACRSGEKNTFGEELVRLGKDANIVVLLGCEPGKRSYEYSSLGHGVFTSYLLRAFKERSLLSPVSGALWTTKVAKFVRANVETYTERDYPTSPQRPYLETEERQDILLGAFPDDQEVHLAEFVDEAKTLSSDRFKAALLDYANRMYSANRLQEAIEAYRVAESTFQLSPADKFVLALACDQAGKTAESKKFFKELQAQTENKLFGALAVMFNPSRDIQPKERVAASKEAWKVQQDEVVAQLVWACLQSFATNSEIVSGIQELLASKQCGERQAEFLTGCMESTKLNWTGAQSHWNKGLAALGELPDDETFAIALVSSKIALGQVAELETFLLKQKSKFPDRVGKWLLLAADLEIEKENFDKAMSFVKQALECNLEPDDLLHCIRVSSLRFLELKDSIIRQSKRFPDSWRAQLATYWVSNLGQADSGQKLDKLIRSNLLVDDAFYVLFECYRLLDVQLDEVLRIGKVTYPDYLQLIIAYSGELIHNVDKFGYDFEPWLLLVKFSLLCERYEQLKLLFDTRLGALLEDGTIPNILRSPYLFAALNMGDSERVAELWKLGGLHPADNLDAAWVLAMARAANGTDVSVDELPKSLPSKNYQAAAKGFLAYLDVCAKRPVDLSTLQKQFPTDQGCMQWVALSWVKLGNWNRALPILKTFHTQRATALTFLQAAVCRVYFDHLIASKKQDLANDVAFNMMISAYGNPLYKPIHFGKDTGVSCFAGRTKFEGATFDILPEMERGVLELDIDAKGVVKGSFVAGNSRYDIAGSVDLFGNLKATMNGQGKAWNMSGKVATAALYRTMDRFRTLGQAFQLLEPNGQGRFMIARPQVSATIDVSADRCSSLRVSLRIPG